MGPECWVISPPRPQAPPIRSTQVSQAPNMCQTLDGALWIEPWMSRTGPCPSRNSSPSHGFGATRRAVLCADAALLAPSPVSTPVTRSCHPRPAAQELVPIQQNRVARGAQVPTPACERPSGICHHALPVSAGRLCWDLPLGTLGSDTRSACSSFYKAKLPSLPHPQEAEAPCPGPGPPTLWHPGCWPGAC